MRIRGALALIITSLAITLPGPGYAWTDPARGFDNPAPEPPAPQFPRFAPSRNAAGFERQELAQYPARYFPGSGGDRWRDEALPPPPPVQTPAPRSFVSVLPPPMAAPVPVEPRRRIEVTEPARGLTDNLYTSSVSSIGLAPIEVQQPDLTSYSSGVSWAEVARAVSTYSTLDTPYTSQIDAIESSRRAQRASKSYATGRPLFALQLPASVPTAPASEDDSFRTAYFLWVTTFFALAALLSFVTWQALRLVFGAWDSRARP